jgi:hypothetical protein
MPVVADWPIVLDVDAVLKGQGADPATLRRRSPRLVELAQRALDEARPVISPQVLYQHLDVEEMRHEQLRLVGGSRLRGPLLAQHLGQAKEVVVVLCTIGGALEIRSSQISREDIVYGLALDGAGSAAVEELAKAACALFEREATESGLQTSIPLSPGMLGWPVEQGQPQIFSILDPSEIGVRVTESMLMIPRKSLTFVLGIGSDMVESARTCDYCSLRETCRYQDHYARAADQI